MAHTTPRVENDTLIGGGASTLHILVDTPDWYTWLTQASSFAFVGPSGRFTARKERRGRADGYWRAYRKSGGRMASVYLGKSADLTLERLLQADTTLATTHSQTTTHQAEPSAYLPHPLPQRPHSLPMFMTPLLGRDDVSLAIVTMLVRDHVRLLTLTGPGGVGKTRLLLHVAGELRDRFADGLFFVDLAAIHDPRHVIPAVAQALGVTEHGGQPLAACLRSFLMRKQLLLLIDNFEHVLPAAMSLPELLAVAPRLKILVTSRAALQLIGEREFPVPTLALPDDVTSAPLDQLLATPAVALFIQRAQAVRPDFQATTETAPIIAEICRQLDGLPLAIELAAARTKLLSPVTLLQRLERRLPLLSGGPRDLPLRHQTLRATIDWSYQLLEPSAKQLLQHLAVFEGSVALDAIEAICDSSADVVDGLAALVGQSLLMVIDDSARTARYRLLDTVREFALEQLHAGPDASSVWERHAMYYLALAEQAEPALQSPDMLEWLDRLDQDHVNLRVALRHLLSICDHERAARLAAALLVFWDVRSCRSEGRSWLEAALIGNALSPLVRAKALWAAGYLARAQFDRSAALALLQESVAIARAHSDERVLAAALTELGWTIVMVDIDPDQATVYLEEGLSRYRSLHDQRGIARALHGLGWVEEHRALSDTRRIMGARWALGWIERRPGSLARARALHTESLALRRAARDTHGVAWSTANLGVIAAIQGEYAAARAFEEERLAIERALDNRHGVADSLGFLGILALRQGDIVEAHTQLNRSLVLERITGDTFMIAITLLVLGEVHLAQSEPEWAATVLEEALIRFNDLNDHHRMARVYGFLAQTALARADERGAVFLAGESIRLARSVDDHGELSICLAGLGDSAARRGMPVWATRLWGAAAAESEAMQSQLTPIEPSDRPQLVAATRAALGPTAFAAAWATGRTLTPEEALVASAADSAPQRAADAPVQRPAGLTAREFEVLQLIAEGLSNAQIAERLAISIPTVKTYLSAIYDKLGVSSRTAAMRYAIDHRL